MKKSNSVRTLILAGSLLLQLNTLCFHARGAAGDVDLSFDPGSGVNGPVNAVVVQPDGKVIIGGEFTTVKGLARPGLARLNADGSGDSSFNPGAMPGGFISLGLQSDGKVVVGNYSGILRLNSDGSQDTNFVASLVRTSDGAAISSIAVQPDGKMLIGGDFYTQNGTNTIYGFARLNANGSLDRSFYYGAALGGASALTVQPDGKVLFITGYGALARLNSNGSLDTSFNPGTGANDAVFSIALQPDGRVLIGGYFSAVNGTNRNGIARLDANGSLDASFNPGTELQFFDGYPYPWVQSIVVQPDGKLIVGGYFTNVNGNSIARFNANGTLDSSFNPGTGANDYVSSIALQSDGRVLIGGYFSTVIGTSRNRIGRLNANGSLDGSFQPGAEVDGGVAALVVQPDGKVLVGGPFTTVNGANRNGFARLNANGTLDTNFQPDIGYHPNIGYGRGIRSFVVQSDGKVLIGGTFGSVNGTNRNDIARLNANGSLDNSFQPNLAALDQSNDCPPGYNCDHYTETTAILVQPDGKVLLGGNFVTIVWGHEEGEDTYSLSRYFLARFNADGSHDSSFNPGTNFSARAIALQPDGKVIFVGGLILNGTNYTIARLNADGSLDSSFNPGTGVYGITSIALQSDGKVLLGGAFTTVNGMNRNRIARLNANGSLDGTFNPGIGPNGDVLAIALQSDGKVIIGGSFTAVNGTNCSGIARVNANGSPDSSFNPGPGVNSLIPGTGINGVVYSVALQPDGKVLIGGVFTTVNGVVRPYVARLYGASVAPSLNIARSNGFVIVSWPSPSTGFVLQQNTDLNPAHWTAPSETVTDNSTIRFISVSPAPGNRFYRLFKP